MSSDGRGPAIPIACDMSGAPDTIGERLAEYRQLFDTVMVGRERTADGIRFRLRADDGVEEWVRDLAVRELACCAFFTFTITVTTTATGREVWWDVGVVDDDGARAVLDDFFRLAEPAS